IQPHPHKAWSQSHRGCTLPSKECILPLTGYSLTLIRHVSNLIEDALCPLKECILPLKGYSLTLIRHGPNLIEDALCLLKECILPLKGFTQLSPQRILILLNPHSYKSSLNGIKRSLSAVLFTHLTGFHFRTEL
ncbi:hypothetical protein, partial [Bartonella queenslandensis]|uniref:hypothetical protein n=1 Tax=Bartonella queenslandensis TaxID=481138 RepID=UPI001BAC3CFF